MPFVGRERELGELQSLLAAASAPAPQGVVAVLTGAPGIGKSRLAAEVSAGFAPAFDVFWAGCGSGGAPPPFWPWTQILADVLRADEALTARASRDWPAAAALATARAAPAAAVVSVDHDLARAELFEDTVALVAAAAERRPLLAVLDDLHDADSSSRLLLEHLVPRVRSLPVVVLGTWRTGGPQAVDPGAVRLLRQVHQLAVAPLGVEEVGALLEGSTGGAVAAPVAAAVHRRTSGNPLLAGQVLAELRARGRLDDAAAVAEVVPDSTRALMVERLADLAPGARQLLAVASAVGTTFAVDVVGAAAGQPADTVLAALGPAVDAGVLASLDPASGAFAHDVLRDAVFAALPPSGRAEVHRAIGVALERLRDGGRAVEPVELARHFLGGGAGTIGKASDYARAAADRAMAMLAYEDAVVLYDQALAAAERSAGDSGTRAELLIAAGEARDATGDRAGARRAYVGAADCARAAGRPDLLAASALGLSGAIGFEVALLDGQQVDLLREALGALPTEAAGLRASLMARLAVAVSFLEDIRSRLRLTDEALSLARAAGDERVVVQALAARCDAIAGPDHCRERVALATEIVEVAVRGRDPQLELLGRRLLAVALLELGDLAGFAREHRAFAATSDAQRRPLYSWYVPLWRAMRAAAEGRAGDAWTALDEAAALGEQAGSRNAVELVVTLRWCLAAELGLDDVVASLMDHMPLDDFPGVWPLVSRSLAAAQLGQLDEARVRLDVAAPRLAEAELDSEWLPMLAQVAEVIGRTGPHPVAAWLYETLLPYRSLCVVEGIGAALRGSVERDLGIAAAALGRRDQAAAHFDAAVAANARIGASLLVARALRDAGIALDDPARLEEARRRYDAMGVERRVAEIDELLGRAGQSVSPHDGPDENRFGRDGEVWLLAYAGREVRVRDSKGVCDLAVLLAAPGRPVPAVALLGAPGAAATRRQATADDGLHEQGDLGDVIDERARQAYRRRLAELEEEIADADRAGDPERSARASAEKDALVAQLAAAFGLGGRPRRAGDPAERARQTVTARVRDAIGRIEAVHPDLGRHLRRSIRTGRVCVYDPDPPVEWSTT